MEVDYIQRDAEMDRIAEAFSEYIHQHPNLDLVWSEKMGYVLLSNDPITGDYSCEKFTYINRYALAFRLFEEVEKDVLLDCRYKDPNVIDRLNDDGKRELKKRWAEFLKKIPEYKDVSEDVFNKNYRPYFDFYYMDL